MSSKYIPDEKLPAAFQAMSYEERYAVVESARNSLARYDDLRNLEDNEIAFIQAQFPDLIRAIDGLRTARRRLDFEIEVTRNPY